MKQGAGLDSPAPEHKVLELKDLIQINIGDQKG